MFEWEEGDRYSFEDSDRFEEDSLCSWMSEPESVCSNWRGWKKAYNYSNQSYLSVSKSSKDGQVLPLVELAAKEVACHIPFEAVERFFPPVPEQLQLRIAYWSFPENEEDIRLYSCLANGSAEEFQRGENLLKSKAVKDLLQIGFHLSASVVITSHIGSAKGLFNVAVTFDRRRITSCNCTCISRASWCSHVVAVCLFRIHQPTQVCLRAPVSESLSRLHRDQLQKFAQYLISELPQQILPTAQRLLDDLLSNQHTKINTLSGAPDPTAGASVNEQTTWCLDESQIHENIRKILVKLCVPSPIVFSDVNYLSYTAHPAAAEWASLLRPLRGREPEGMWNLLSIVREMFRRGDRNAIPLLEILTEEVLACDQIILWWFNTKVTFHAGGNGHGSRNSLQGNTHASQHACSSLCDEIVVLWRLACLNPALNSQERKSFFDELHNWHIKTLEKVWKLRSSGGNSNGSSSGNNNANSGANKRSDFDLFPGFKPSMEACFLDWDDYPIPGVTHTDGCYRRWNSPCSHAHSYKDNMNTNVSVLTTSVTTSTGTSYICNRRIGKSNDSNQESEKRNTQIDLNEKASDTAEALSCNLSVINSSDIKTNEATNDDAVESNRSSFSSEGFCETSETEHLDSDATAFTGDLLSPKRKNLKTLQNLRDSNLEDINSKTSEANLNVNYSENAHSSVHKTVDNSSVESCDNDAGVAESVDHKKLAPNEAGTSSESAKADEYQLYRYDPSTINSSLSNSNDVSKSGSTQRKNSGNSSNNLEENFVVIVKKMEDPFEILFARAEALHAHGLSREASQLAIQLAEEILTNPPNLMVDLPNPPVRGKRGRRFNPSCHQISLLASATLSKAAFLCSVLSENVENNHLAFRVGLFGLELARPPASTKALEVKLANQEQDLVVLLKKIPLTGKQLQVLREKAEQLRDGKLKSRGEALLPLMLASYIFDALVLSSNQQSRNSQSASCRFPTDEILGFEAAVAALGLKANVSEAEHPLLCEGTRRQRGDLAITLLVHYKDDKEKLAKIMDKLLDKEVHQMYKNPSSGIYVASTENSTPDSIPSLSQSTSETGLAASSNSSNISSSNSDESDNRDQGIEMSCQSGDNSGEPSNYTRPETRRRGQLAERRVSDGDRSEGASSPGWDEDYKAWEARFRCTNLKTAKKHSVGMASIDSSAPETTSSDNSPTVVRRYIRQGGPGSDSGSSGESSDSFASSSSGDKVSKKAINVSSSAPFVGEGTSSHMTTVTSRLNNCSISDSTSISSNRLPNNSTVTLTVCSSQGNATVSTTNVTSTPSLSITSTSVLSPNASNCSKTTRFKGKRANPSIPNQPSQALSHFMFELAKTVLTKAGGNSSSGVLFTQPSSSQNHRLPHRALHMCAFQIGLYALGLHNAVTPNWLSRTYSSHVSWITGQAAEIGAPAIIFLIDTWEGHLTPPEVASLADRASRGRDRSTVKAAARLALSCLPHAHALNPNEIQRALIQCRELSNDTLEQACLAIETAAKGGGVYPEVLFEVARNWYALYEESLPKNGGRSNTQVHNNCSDNQTPYVQASIGEFQVPTSDSSNTNNNSYNVSPETTQQMLAPNERQMQEESIVAVTRISHPSTPCGPFAAIPQSPPQLPIQVLQTSPYTMSPHPASAMPYRFFSGIPPFPPAPPIPLHPAYIQGPPPFQYPYYSPTTSTGPVAVATVPHLRGALPPNALFPAQPMLPSVVVTQSGAMNQAQRLPLIPTSGPQTYMIPLCGPVPELHMQPPFSINSLPHQPQQPLQQLNQRQLGYLLSAYRVGMLAMEILARRVHDDRPQAKYARNPPYGEDVKWLLGIAKKLGTSYLQEFCICTVNSVASPFILLEIVLDAISYLSQSSNPPIPQPLRSPMITPLIHKCQQMFVACTHFKMYHISPADYEEFVQVIRGARQAFQLTQGGMVQFNELLQNLKRSKSYKKELWQHVTNALQQNANSI